MRIAIIATVFCVSLARLVSANEANVATRLPTHIPAQALEDALKAFAQERDLQVLYFSRIAKDLRTDGASGELTADEVLTKLLNGTGLTYRYVSQKAVTILPVEAVSSSLNEGKASVNWGRSDGPRVAQADGFPSPSAGEDQGDDNSHSPRAAEARGEASADESKKESLQEIVVTAQKREERLKDVPISISVLSGRDLDASRFEGASEALSTVPGVSVSPAFQSGGTQLSVRGVSAGGPLFSGASPIGYYIDSVPFGLVNSAIAPDPSAYDLKQIEVLRGPQGTLYGASTVNGVVRILTADADPTKFDLKLRASNSGTGHGGNNYRGDAAVNVPIIEGALAVRAVAGYEENSGWIDAPNATDVNDARLRNLRLKVNAQPTENLSIGLSAWQSNSDYGAPSIGKADVTQPSLKEQPISTDFDSYGLKIGYSFPRFVATSSTGYLQYSNKGDLDLFSLIALPWVLRTDLKSEITSEELNFTSRSGGIWRWSAGAFYRKGSQTLTQYIQPVAAPELYTQWSKSTALFGELTRLFLGDQLELTVGLRRFYDDVTGSGPPGTGTGWAAASFHSTTPRAVVTWHANRQSTLYASYSEGYRSGTFPTGSPKSVLPPTKPDTLRNFELGVKSDLSDRFSYEAAVFYMKWVDVQELLTVPGGGTGNIPVSGIVNGDSASGAGAELSLAVRPLANLTLRGTLSWNGLENDSHVISNGVILFHEGDRLNFSPKYTSSAAAEYGFALGQSGLTGRLSVSANYMSEQTNSLLVGNAVTVATGDSMLIARSSFALEFADHFTATVFVDNLTNEKGTPLAAPYGVGGAWDARVRPRTVGIQFEYRLGKSAY